MDERIKEIIMQSYNANTNLRDVDTIIDWKQVELDKFIVSTKLMNESRILDLGAGSGIYAKYMKTKGLDVTCIDISKGMVELCCMKGLAAEVMDFYNLKYKDNTFDAIWSMNTLLHVPKSSIDIVLEEVKRVLKDNGIFYLGIYGGISSEGIWENDFYEPKRFFSFYTNPELREILEKYFYIESFETLNIHSKSFKFQSVIMKKVI